jgi:hypothetical protein
MRQKALHRIPAQVGNIAIMILQYVFKLILSLKIPDIATLVKNDDIIYHVKDQGGSRFLQTCTNDQHAPALNYFPG